MTKKQAIPRARIGLTLDGVVAAAFEVLNDNGLEKLSTRAIAAKLGVSMNTVMWHIGTKDRLFDLMAESIVGQIDVGNLDEPWQQQATDLVQRLRAALLSHRDGAAVVAGTFPAMPSTLAFADRLLTVLFHICPTRRTAAWTVWSLFYFTLGLVQEEQRAPAELHQRMETATDQHRYPALNAVLDDFLCPDYGTRFTFGVKQILQSAVNAEATRT